MYCMAGLSTLNHAPSTYTQTVHMVMGAIGVVDVIHLYLMAVSVGRPVKEMACIVSACMYVPPLQ